MTSDFEFPLFTQRLILRPFDQLDAVDYTEAILESVSVLSPWLPWCTNDYTIRDAAEWFLICHQSMKNNSAYNLGIFDQNTREFIGCIAINHIQHDNLIGNVGYWIKASRQGHGYALEALKSMVSFAFYQLKLVRLEFVVAIDNKVSNRVVLKAGATFEGRARNKMLVADGPVDANIYSLIPADLQNF